MTIPLPEPIFWDPATATGDYAVVEQKAGLFLLRPRQGGSSPGCSRMAQDWPSVSVRIDPRRRCRAQRSFLRPRDGRFGPASLIPATPTIEDLDRDGSAELICVTREGWVWVIGQDALPPAGWPVQLGVGCLAAPALADLDGDGLLEILVGDELGRLHVFRRDGTYLRGWPAKFPGRGELPTIYGAVTVADIDRDGLNDVVVTQARPGLRIQGGTVGSAGLARVHHAF